MNRQIARRGFFCLALCLLALAGRAQPPKGLYEVDVPVAGQDERSRAAAVQAGFRAVLLKVAGSAAVLDNPSVSAAAARADTYLLQYYFTRIGYPPREGGPAAEEPGLHVVFPPRSVDEILRRAGVPVLPPNRPPTLAWIAIDDGAGPRLMSRELDTVAADWLSFHATRRAVPVLFPQMDLEDSAAVTPEQVWALEPEAPRRAAARYATESVLVARLVRASDGSWLGEWRHFLGEEGRDGQGAAPALDGLAGQLADFTAEAVAAHYAVQTGLQDTQQLRLRVDGVGGFAAYRQLTGLLKAMASVRGLQLVLLDRDSLFFDLLTDSDFASVTRELSLLPQLQSEGAEGELRYRWVGG